MLEDSRPALLPSGQAKPLSVSDQKTATVSRPDVVNKQSVTTLLNHEHSGSKAETQSATIDVAKPAYDKLKQEIKRCKKFHLGRTFVVNDDER